MQGSSFPAIYYGFLLLAVFVWKVYINLMNHVRANAMAVSTFGRKTIVVSLKRFKN